MADWYEIRKAQEKAIAHHENIQQEKMLNKMNKPRTNHWGGINWELIADNLNYAITMLIENPNDIATWRKVFELQDKYFKAKDEFSR